MNSKAVRIVVINWLVVMAQLWPTWAYGETAPEKDFPLKVYLPREVEIKGDAIKLGKVGIVRGKESFVAQASEIALGRITVPGQKIVVDRSMVLSRLACNGIPASQVTLTGAEETTISQEQRTIRGDRFIEVASAFLKENPPAGSVCQCHPIRIPSDLIIPGAGKDIEFSPRLATSGGRNRVDVEIAVLADGNAIAAREVPFRLKYDCRTAVTVGDIGAGEVISPENVKIGKTISNYPEPADWKPPYGLITKRPLPANTVLRPYMVGSVKPAVVVERNQTVVIRIERPGLLITAIGKAVQDGRAGGYIKVRNVDSRRIILARVNEDGTVAPVL
jgi:flagella basal body P-ring formation protein FlgA